MSLRKIFLLSFIVMLLSSSQSFAEGTYAAGDVIVVLRSSGQVSASSSSVKSAASSFADINGASLTKVYPALSKADRDIFALIHSDDIDPEEFSKMLLKNPNVIAASPNYIVRAAVVPNDTYMSRLWGLDAVNMPSSWDKETGSNDVYAAIIDSGIDWTNPDLTANVARSLGFTSSGISSSQPGLDNHGHGTHVAGIIGAAGNNGIGIAGVNWYVRMIPVKALDKNGSGTVDTVIEGMNYVAQLISEGYNIRTVNLSLALYANMPPTHNNLITEPMWRAFKVIDEYNQAVMVVAAGNEGVAIGKPTTYTKREGNSIIFEPGDYAYPSSFVGLNNMITVSALGSGSKLSSYSNTGADISAPGGDYETDGSYIISTWLQSSAEAIGEDGAAVAGLCGTSMATPHVAGAAALLSAHDPGMTAYQIKQCILGTAASGGEGILDVNAALEYQETYGSGLVEEGTEGDAYSDWNNYEPDEPSSQDDTDDPYPYDPYNERDSSSSSGGCNGFMLGAFAVIFLLPLARKFMN